MVFENPTTHKTELFCECGEVTIMFMTNQEIHSNTKIKQYCKKCKTIKTFK